MAVAMRFGDLTRSLSFSLERGPLVRLPQVREPNPRTGEQRMKSEQIKEITERATEQLVAALNAGHSEAHPHAPSIEVRDEEVACVLLG
jgi:hypothetical protein